MMKKNVYIVLCVLGAVIPMTVFVPFALENGADMGLFVREMFGTQVASFLSADLMLSSLALWVFIFFEVRKQKIKYWWLSIIANFAVGLSLALPLFLLLRETSEVPEKRKRHG
jgi:4-amino-4-deoxy-L-arabinose transferase-like glycosyltransferase